MVPDEVLLTLEEKKEIRKPRQKVWIDKPSNDENINKQRTVHLMNDHF